MLDALALAFVAAFGLILMISAVMLAVRLWPLTLLAVLVWACVGCGAADTELKPGFRSVRGSPEQAELAQATLDVFRNLVDVEPDRIDLVFADTWPEQRDACQGYAACTIALRNGYLVTTFWPPEWDESHPKLLAHELCHVRYLQTGEGGDPAHSHIECFDKSTGFSAEVAMIVVKQYLELSDG